MRRLLAAWILAAWLPAAALAQDVRLAESSPLNIGMTLTLQSEALAEQRKVYVALPPGYEDSAKRYPVVYVLDAQNSWLFQYAYGEASALAALDRMPEVILVGVVSENRALDMTVASPENEGGRADAFVEFFSDELTGFIDAQFRTQPYATLIGHSLGASFALHALFQQPDTFDAYIALSPALWFDDGKVFHLLTERLAAGLAFDNALFTSLADEDEDMLAYYEDFVQLMADTAPEGLAFSQMRFPEEDHGSTTLPGIHHGMLATWQNWVPPESIDSFDAMLAYYENLSEYYGYPILMSAEQASDLGFDLFDAGDAAGALEIFEYSLANLDQSPFEHHQRGLALRELGRIDEALAAFDSALAAGPAPNFREMFTRDRDDVARQLEAAGKPAPR